MTDVQVLMGVVRENLAALLHGSDDDAVAAVDRMLFVVDDDPSFGALCGMLAEIGGDALREHRAGLPAGPARSAPFGLIPMPESATLPERMAAQLVTASANGDHPMTMSLLSAVLSWQHVDPMSKLAARLAVHARMLHLSVCSDSASGVEAGA
ncbi:hypothetical protein AB1K56_08085 [Microbacterium sp. BWR-S6Y]|uniref:hypothetical protein n=1 Tax=Microbacterium sp. BWR-S6Y TaxID=3232073 RepID=UPI003528C159